MKVFLFWFLFIGTLQAQDDFHGSIERQLAQELNAYQKSRRLTSLSFSLFLGRDHEFHHAIGYADAGAKLKATEAHMYTLASVTKPITAATLLDLLDRHAILLSDSVYKYIAGFPRNVRIQDLLNHTSGFLRERENENFIRKSSYKNVVDYLPVQFKSKIHRYANVNYSALGALIEQIADSSYAEVAGSYFHRTTGGVLHFANHSRQEDNALFVKNYVRHRRRQKVHKLVDFGLWEPAAFGQTSSRDLMKFMRFHMKPAFLQYLSEHAVITKKRRLPGGSLLKECYALGFRLSFIDDELKYVYHNGFIYGVLSTVYYFPARRVGFVAVSNMSSYPKRTLGLGGLYRIVERIVDEQFNRHLVNYALTHGYEAGIQFYEENKAFGEVQATLLSRRANEVLSRGRIDEAIDLLKLNIHAFPDSGETYQDLGKAYLKSGYKELAIESFKRALALDPEMEGARNYLIELSQ